MSDISTPTVARKTGKVKFFDSRKGFGFIKPDDGSRDVHVTLNRLPKECNGHLDPDQRCSYVVAEKDKGPFAKEFSLL